jgi:hypothetical protein
VIGNIVKFNENAKCNAAIWCRENNVLGKVISDCSGVQSSYLIIDVGLGYGIYANESQLSVVAETGDLESLSADLMKTAPIPDEGE